MRRFTHSLGIASLGLLFILGCDGQPKGVPLSGKIILPKTLNLGENGMVELRFVPVEGNETGAAVARYSASDSTFTVDRSTAPGIAPGKYKITVRATLYQGGSSPKATKTVEDFNKAYSESVSRMTYEVTPEGPQSITIDLTVGKVTKN